jgi:predicted permease
MDALLQDLRYAFRRLRATPGFTAVAVFTLALGLGVNTMMFSIVNAVLFPPQPVAEPDRVVGFFWHDRLRPRDGGTGISYPEFLEIAGRTELFESVCASRLTVQPLTIAGETTAADGGLVTAECSAMFGVRALRGRLLGAEDQTNAGQLPAVMSEHLWRTRFGGRDDVVGATVRFGGRDMQIVGVAPRGVGWDLWVPLSMAPHGGVLPTPPGFRTDRAWRHFSMRARLRPGVTLEQVEAQAPALSAAFAAADPTLPPEHSLRVTQPQVRQIPWEFALQLVLSGFVLLIACANLAGLLLVRGTARANELAVRLAIGASRVRLVRQLLIESLLLALGGGLAGFIVTVVLAASLESLHVPRLPGVSEFQVDWRVLVFALAAAAMTSVLFGLVPALRVTRTDVSRQLGGGDVVLPGGHRRLLSVRSLLIVGQFAVSMLFVLVSGVLVAGFLTASSAETGLGRMDAAAVQLESWVERPTADEFRSFTDTLRRRADDRADLYGVAFASALPAGGATWGNLRTEGPGDGITRAGGSVVVSPGLLDALGIPLLHGRDFNEHDRRDTPRVALVSQTAAREWWPGEDALGKRVYFHGLGGWHEVVGVAADTRASLLRDRQELVYLAMAQHSGMRWLVIGSSRNGGAAAVEGLRRLIHEVVPDLPVSEGRTVRQWLDSFLYRQWITATGAATLGGLALFLASLGLYGSMAYAVSCRQRELGLRMVLGADARAIRRLMLWQGFRLVIVGAAVGLYAALLTIEAIAKITTAVPGTGVTAYLLGPAVMIAVALLAAYLPARRAARVDPMVTLRAL